MVKPRLPSVGQPLVETRTNYTYDGIDANGNQETRGLLTKTVTTMGGRTLEATGAYDAHGTLTTEKLPGGVIRRETYDLIGELVSVQYTRCNTTAPLLRGRISRGSGGAWRPMLPGRSNGSTLRQARLTVPFPVRRQWWRMLPMAMIRPDASPA